MPASPGHMSSQCRRCRCCHRPFCCLVRLHRHWHRHRHWRRHLHRHWSWSLQLSQLRQCHCQWQRCHSPSPFQSRCRQQQQYHWECHECCHFHQQAQQQQWRHQRCQSHLQRRSPKHFDILWVETLNLRRPLLLPPPVHQHWNQLMRGQMLQKHPAAHPQRLQHRCWCLHRHDWPAQAPVPSLHLT